MCIRDRFHDTWNYVYYIYHLWKKSRRELNGQEIYIYSKLEMNDLSWLPLRRSMELETAVIDSNEEGESINTIMDSLQQFKRMIGDLKFRLGSRAETLNRIIKGSS
eukprot:TRINITY_DN8612_c0_g1_i1.p1 TRINITY_DN8612_c0_g1~~TRINITY_DN8612_c0_g1_i1.p1  ORF type:complete len:122 (-),score=30.79 TRINITY_DN8612_c0_g1_i1:84-401(-)